MFRYLLSFFLFSGGGHIDQNGISNYNVKKKKKKELSEDYLKFNTMGRQSPSESTVVAIFVNSVNITNAHCTQIKQSDFISCMCMLYVCHNALAFYRTQPTIQTCRFPPICNHL